MIAYAFVLVNSAWEKLLEGHMEKNCVGFDGDLSVIRFVGAKPFTY